MKVFIKSRNLLKRAINSRKMRYIANSFLSVSTRFLLTFYFADYLNWDFTGVYIFAYIYVLLQSYLINKLLIFKPNDNNLLGFIGINLLISVIEYLCINQLESSTFINYSLSTLVIGLITFISRYLIYENIIFKNE